LSPNFSVNFVDGVCKFYRPPIFHALFIALFIEENDVGALSVPQDMPFLKIAVVD
jgi:hypothetical protein